jgi:hypothetical protein
MKVSEIPFCQFNFVLTSNPLSLLSKTIFQKFLVHLAREYFFLLL